MTAGKRDNQTNLLGGRSVLGLIAALIFAQGCTVVPNVSSDVQPDMKAIVAVVSEAYDQLEQAPSVFLGADAVEDTTMARVRTSLSDDLASTFRPPSARISEFGGHTPYLACAGRLGRGRGGPSIAQRWVGAR